MLANGHASPAPYRYTIGRLWTEAEMVRLRYADQLANETVAMNQVIVAALNSKIETLNEYLAELRA